MGAFSRHPTLTRPTSERTPIGELIGQRVLWRPKNKVGQREPATVGLVVAHDAAARSLTVEQGGRRVQVPLAFGPFRPTGGAATAAASLVSSSGTSPRMFRCAECGTCDTRISDRDTSTLCIGCHVRAAAAGRTA